MKILYIGGTGEISTSCVRESVKLGHDVSVFNRSIRAERLPDGVNVIKGDLKDDAAYRDIARQAFDVICQFIIFETDEARRDIEFFSGHTGQYVFISSASAYYKPLDRFAVVSEETPLRNAYWEYSQKKQAMEELFFAAHGKRHLPVTVVRPSHTYRKHFPVPVFEGDWTAKRMLDGKPILVHGDGASLWTLTHADDFAKPFARLLGNEQAIGEAFHITQSEPYTWLEILNAMGTALGVKPEFATVASDTIIRYMPDTKGELLGDKTPSTIFDNSKVKRVAGDFSCDVSLDEGMAGVAKSFKERVGRVQTNPEWDALCDKIIAEQRSLAT